MMAQYAARTDVSSSQSRADIERVLTRYGADQFGYMSGVGVAQIMFVFKGTAVRFTLPMPDRKDFRHTPTGKVAAETVQESNYEQAVRQRWRALLLVTKAKLEAVESGISTFEQEFLAHIVLPGGQTVAEAVIPQVMDAIASGTPTRLSIEG
jgi:hypothetical protein